MDKLFVSNQFKQALQQANFTTFDDFFQLKGELVSRSHKRPVYKVSIEINSQVSPFFLKIVDKVSLKNILTSLKKGLGFHTEVYREQAQIKRYQKANIPVMSVIAWGERFKWGWRPCAGFILLEAVDGIRLDEFIVYASTKEKQQAFFLFGELIGRMHKHGITEITRVQDIIYQQSQNHDVRLVIIDREHGALAPKQLSLEQTANYLARLYLKTIAQLEMKAHCQKMVDDFFQGYAKHSQFELKTLQQSTAAGLKKLIANNKKYQAFAWVLNAQQL